MTEELEKLSPKEVKKKTVQSLISGVSSLLTAVLCGSHRYGYIGLFVFAILFFGGFGVFHLFLAWGLWKRKLWAWRNVWS